MEISFGVLMGLGTFFLWGVGDFVAATLCRAHGVRRTLMWTQFFALGLASLAALYLFFHDPAFSFQLPLKTIWFLGLLGLIQGASYIAFFKGLGEGVISVVSPISASWSLITVVWAWWIGDEVLDWIEYAGIVVILSGIFFTAVQPAKVKELTGKQLAKGATEGFVAMLCWGISLTLLVPVVRQHGWFVPVFIMRVWAFLFSGAAFLAAPRFLSRPRILRPPYFGFLAVAACDIGGLFFFSEGVRSSLASIVAPVAASFPLITVLLAAWRFREKLYLTQKLGIAFVVAGLILLSV